MLIALIQAQSVRHGKLAERFAGSAQLESVVRRLERFFARHPIHQAQVAALVLACLPAGKLTFVLDRTNWILGQQDLNVLVLAVLHGNTAIPLLWEWLPHGGSSAQSLRTDLLEDLFTLLEPKRVAMLLGDREFIGAAWFETLWLWAVLFCIRIKDDTRLDDLHAGEFFADLAPGETVVMGHTLCCYGVPLTVAALLSPQRERVLIASTLCNKHIFKWHGQRFRIECLFRHLKTKGFRLEETHMTEHDKLDRLVCVLVIVYLWGVLLGTPVKVALKAHGRRARAIFAVGLSLLTRGFQYLGQRFETFVQELIALIPLRPYQTVGY